MSFIRRSSTWFVAFTIWFSVLWMLSSQANNMPVRIDFRHIDKILHFGYFFGGAGLLSAAIFRRKPELHASTRILIVVIFVTLVGAIDEAHQSFIPGRSGNDAGDLTADFLGAILGSLVFQRFRKFLS